MSKQIKLALTLLVLFLIPISAEKLKIAGRVTTPGNGIFYIDCEIQEEGTYEVQRAPSVASSSWTVVSNFHALPGNFTVQEPMSGPSRYYRLARITNAPAMTLHPQGTTNYVGAPIQLTASASGSAPLRLQWFKDGQPTGTTGTNLAFTAQTSHSGAYTLVATNPWGKATSQVAQVRILATAAPSISGKSIRFTIQSGQGDFPSSGTYTAVFNPQGYYNTTGSSPLLNDTGYWLYGVLGEDTARILYPGSVAYPDGQATLLFQNPRSGAYQLVAPGKAGSQAGQFEFLD